MTRGELVLYFYTVLKNGREGLPGGPVKHDVPGGQRTTVRYGENEHMKIDCNVGMGGTQTVSMLPRCRREDCPRTLFGQRPGRGGPGQAVVTTRSPNRKAEGAEA